MNQEDINDIIAKNPSPEAEINSRPTYGYSKQFVMQVVDNLFQKYASQYRQDAINDLKDILKQ